MDNRNRQNKVSNVHFLKLSSLTTKLFYLALLFFVENVSAQPELVFEKAGKQSSELHFVENTQCLECHAEQAKEWKDSHHALAMSEAEQTYVKGDFNDVVFTHQQVSSRFFRAEDKYFVNTIGPDGKLTDFEIKYTFGVEPLQQYIIELERGHLQTLDIAWDTREKSVGGQKWFKLNPDESAEAGDPFHWTGRAYTWNNRCAECHSTNIKKNYDLATDSYKTTWSEINVSCQSCHGPGQAHLEWTGLSDITKASQQDKGLVVDYLTRNSKVQNESCASCHSRRHQVSADDVHGKPLLDNFLPARLSEELYYADGQIKEEVFVYGSFMQSKMHEQGVSCLDCHNPHTAKIKLTGNELCLQCHNTSPPQERFTSLKAKNYDSPEHYFHKQNSEGAQCVNCHMPATTYMEVDPRRDHSFKIPNPALSQKINSPNACNSCHQNKSVQWAIDQMAAWYGEDFKSTGQAAAETMYLARHGEISAWKGLVDIINNPNSRPIVTATALEQLVNYFPRHEAIKATIDSLSNDDDFIRATAASSLEHIPLRYRLALATPLLDDPSRAVRIQAARVVGGLPELAFGEDSESFTAALQEYKDLQTSLADTPEAHINLAVLYTEQRSYELAEQEYLAALKLAPEFVPAYINLANLYNQLGRNKEAETHFRSALKIADDNGEVYYSLGLLLAEQQRYAEALVELAKAKTLLPGRRRVEYNYALALQQLKQYSAAESVLQKLYLAQPNDQDMVYALVTLYAQQEKWQQALPYAKLLVELTQGEEGPTRLLQQIQSMMNSQI